jgi:hypothetical protein
MASRSLKGIEIKEKLQIMGLKTKKKILKKRKDQAERKKENLRKQTYHRAHLHDY